MERRSWGRKISGGADLGGECLPLHGVIWGPRGMAPRRILTKLEALRSYFRVIYSYR